MERRLEGVFFDAGSTLIDPVEAVEATYLRYAREFDPTIDGEAFGVWFRKQWKRLDQDYRSSHPDLETSAEMEREAWYRFTFCVAEPFAGLRAAHEEWLRLLVGYFDRGDSWVVLPGGREVLRQLREQGCRLAVVSNWHESLEGILRFHGLAELVDEIVISSRLGRKKPHPLMFDWAMERMGLDRAKVIHVGDSWREDVVGGLNAGLRVVYFDRRGDCPESEPAVPVIRSLSELLDGGWNGAAR
jgi:putative hydrolase of the HAD superfamily